MEAGSTWATGRGAYRHRRVVRRLRNLRRCASWSATNFRLVRSCAEARSKSNSISSPSREATRTASPRRPSRSVRSATSWTPGASASASHSATASVSGSGRESVSEIWLRTLRASVPATASRRLYNAVGSVARSSSSPRVRVLLPTRYRQPPRGAMPPGAERRTAAGSSGRPARSHRSRLSGAGHSTVRMCCTPLPPSSALHHDLCSALTRANGTCRSSSRAMLLLRMIGCRRVATHRT